MSEKDYEKLELVYDPEDVPEGLSDEEQLRYWETHDVTEEFLDKVEEVPEDERPHPRTTPVNIRFDEHTLGRLRDLATSRNVGYQTLLKMFVTDRLYQEEMREGILAATSREEAKEPRSSSEPTERQKVAKPRDWQSEAYEFVKENEGIFEDADLNFIVSSRVLKDATSLLLEISKEIKAASAKKKFPAAKLKRMLKGYERLESFVKKAFDAHEEKFGLPNPNETGTPESNTKQEEGNSREEGPPREASASPGEASPKGSSPREGTQGQLGEDEQQGRAMATVTSIENYKSAKNNLANAEKETG